MLEATIRAPYPWLKGWVPLGQTEHGAFQDLGHGEMASKDVPIDSRCASDYTRFFCYVSCERVLRSATIRGRDCG